MLRGHAESPDKSTQAVRTASRVEGVRTVDDLLSPRRPGTSHRADARTEVAVLRTLIADDALPAESMHVRVSDGTATLSGRVEFPDQREEAEKLAMAVPGVSEVRNQLSVWIRVSVNEVTKRGSVRSAADRDAAIAAAAAARAVVDVEDEIQVA